MAGKLTFTLADYQEAAAKWRKDLLMLPIIGIQDTLQYMTGRPGVRYKESVGTMSGDAQFAPYKPSRTKDFDLNVDYRELETFFGSVVALFEPNSAISTLFGTGATKGDGQMQTPTAKMVLALIAKKLSANLNNSIWKAVRNPNGDNTTDLFNGFDTITSTEITAGNISAANGNFIQLSEAITKTNAVDIIKEEILFKLDDNLRDRDCLMFCTRDIADKYNEAYLLTHAGISYNTKYNQPVIEGSDGHLTLVPLANKKGSSFIHITPKSNMLVGYDQMGDVESIAVEKHAPFILSYIATMFFGVQFESIAKENLTVVKLAEESEEEGGGSGSGSGSGSGEQGGNGGSENGNGENGGENEQNPEGQGA